MFVIMLDKEFSWINIIQLVVEKCMCCCDVVYQFVLIECQIQCLMNCFCEFGVVGLVNF